MRNSFLFRLFSCSLSILGCLTLAPCLARAATVSGPQKVVVLRVYFHDYTKTSRYTQAQVQGFFSEINTLWGTHSSYGNMSINAEVNSDLIQLPGNRLDYVDDHSDGDTSDGPKYMKVLRDAVAASTSPVSESRRRHSVTANSRVATGTASPQAAAASVARASTWSRRVSGS